jgi:chitinase
MPTSSPAASSSAASSSAYDVGSSSAPYPSGNITYAPYPTGVQSSSVAPSVVYPQETPIVSASSTLVYPHPGSELIHPSLSSSVHFPVNNATTPCTTSTEMSSSTSVHAASTTPGSPVYVTSSSSTPGAPVYGASSTPVAPVHGASSSAAPVYGAASSSSGKASDSYPASSSVVVHGGEYPPSVTSAPGMEHPSYPTSSTVKTITTTYVDACKTGVTTKTETITQTVCNKCQGDSVTSVYVCHNCGPSVVTITVTKPSMPTNVASHPTPAAKPEGPMYGGDKPQGPAQSSSTAMPQVPAQSSSAAMPQAPAQSSAAAKPEAPVYGADVPKKQEMPIVKSTTVSIVYVTMTAVPDVPAAENTPMPYPSAAGAGYPIKPVVGTGAPMASGTGVYVKPSGTGAPIKPSAYSPAQFTGAASHVGVGMTGLLVVVASLLVL